MVPAPRPAPHHPVQLLPAHSGQVGEAGGVHVERAEGQTVLRHSGRAATLGGARPLCCHLLQLQLPLTDSPEHQSGARLPHPQLVAGLDEDLVGVEGLEVLQDEGRGDVRPALDWAGGGADPLSHHLVVHHGGPVRDGRVPVEDGEGRVGIGEPEVGGGGGQDSVALQHAGGHVSHVTETGEVGELELTGRLRTTEVQTGLRHSSGGAARSVVLLVGQTAEHLPRPGGAHHHVLQTGSGEVEGVAVLVYTAHRGDISLQAALGDVRKGGG